MARRRELKVVWEQKREWPDPCQTTSLGTFPLTPHAAPSCPTSRGSSHLPRTCTHNHPPSLSAPLHPAPQHICDQFAAKQKGGRNCSSVSTCAVCLSPLPNLQFSPHSSTTSRTS